MPLQNNYMKKNRILIGLLCLSAVGAMSSDRKQPTQVVIIQGQQFYWNYSFTDPFTGAVTYKYEWGGIRVYNADSSPGAPEYVMPTQENLTYSTNDYAGTIAGLIDQGFRLAHTSADGLTSTLVKP